MKSGPYSTSVTSSISSASSQWMPTSSRLESFSTFHKRLSDTKSLKMKTTKTRKRPSPKHTPLTPLPPLSSIFESSSSSHSSSSNSSYGSYCQFSPEGSYTMYHYPMNYIPYVPEPIIPTTCVVNCATSTDSALVHSPPMSADEHKPVDQPLFIQTADYPYDYSVPDPSGGYPSSATINASQLLLRPVPNGHAPNGQD
ncbi:unnamed protein product [Caenorhabditis sp. 36 PRJEB53466]|nr:unnamed protein product [Caenorhabditis sp. 36 PRJEB53466]